jgi:hypothetical protein
VTLLWHLMCTYVCALLALCGFKSYMFYVLFPEDGGWPPEHVGGKTVYFLYTRFMFHGMSNAEKSSPCPYYVNTKCSHHEQVLILRQNVFQQSLLPVPFILIYTHKVPASFILCVQNGYWIRENAFVFPSLYPGAPRERHYHFFQ